MIMANNVIGGENLDGKYCGMNTCKKCAAVNLIFGILFLVVGLGWWSNAPAWWNGWTLVGLYALLWGLATLTMGPH